VNTGRDSFPVPVREAKAPNITNASKEIILMNRTRTFVAAGVVLAGIVGCGVALAQTPASPSAKTPTPAASAPASSTPSAGAQVETWTTKQWETAKKKWATDKKKWADCRKQSSTQKLEGRASWSFLYKCMTS
jgi:hypothetical protein